MTATTEKSQEKESLHNISVPEIVGGSVNTNQPRHEVPIRGVSQEEQEKRIALIHRVIIEDDNYPKEYAILVTNRRLIFIRLEKTRSTFVLRYEMKIGTALVTDVEPKTLEDYEETSLESLVKNTNNFTISNESILSLVMKADEFQHRRRDFMLWWIMTRQKEIFQVYNFEITFLGDKENRTKREEVKKFYAVPLGAYFKPRRQVQNRETILREYAEGLLQIFQKALPNGRIDNNF